MGLLSGEDRAALLSEGSLPREVADRMIENAIGTIEIPLGIGLNLQINGRDRLVPINRRYPLRELVRAAEFYAETTGRRVTLEYILLAGVNDRKGDAERLADLANSLPCKINLIPYNPVPQLPWQRPTDEAIQRFADWLAEQSRDQPRFVSDNNGFDWQFINWYFHHFLGRNPFGHSSTNLGSLYKGLVKDTRQNFKHLRRTPHTHDPLDDALGNAEALLHMHSEMGLLPSLTAAPKPA